MEFAQNAPSPRVIKTHMPFEMLPPKLLETCKGGYTLSLVAGYADGAPQLQAVDLYGTTWKGDFLLTGFAQYFCQVLCQNAWRPDFTEAEARALAEECMRVLFYRDSRATEVI